MYTSKSTLREVYQNPIGKDLIDMLLRNAGRSSKLIDNPAVGSMRIGILEKLPGIKMPGITKTLLKIINNHPEKPPVASGPISRKWWKEAVAYQIYPRSFQDSDGDGIGDINGIKDRVPYLKELGVDMVWLSPIYDSPGDDMGYDIRNYRKISKEFGNLRDFGALVNTLHKNDMRIIMDLVVNHTSDEHEWFQKALEDPNSPEKDYYIWAKGRHGGETAQNADGITKGSPPNNWTSFFSGPAWNYYPENDEWALHLFSKKQMDLNWDNPQLRHQVYDMINWWLDRGIDGFRLDVINFISKDNLDDGNDAVGATMGIQGIEHYFYGPKLHDYLQEMNRESFAGRDVFTVGETPGVGIEMAKMLTAEERKELDLIFNFDHLDNPGKSRNAPYKYNLQYLKPYFLKWQTQYGDNCWQSLFFENHDNPRMVSKINPDPAWRVVISKLLAILQLTLKGTPFIYQGQELGMTNTTFTSPGDFRDVEAINRYNELADLLGPGYAMSVVSWGTRDHARTPMQWDASENAGFTTGEPWLHVNLNYPVINAKNEMDNPNSVYNFYKELIALRKNSDTLVYGDFQPVFLRDKNTFCYFRRGKGEKYYIEINLTGEDQRRPGPLTGEHKLVAGNYGGTSVLLRPYEANIYSLGSDNA